jgi:hypothetical protein
MGNFFHSTRQRTGEFSPFPRISSGWIVSVKAVLPSASGVRNVNFPRLSNSAQTTELRYEQSVRPANREGECRPSIMSVLQLACSLAKSSKLYPPFGRLINSLLASSRPARIFLDSLLSIRQEEEIANGH